MKVVSGFSKMSKREKISWLANAVEGLSPAEVLSIDRFWHPDEKTQARFDEFTENTLTNYYLPFGVSPNFIINEKVYTVPMVIEESSVVAAASLGAKFWQSRGGFKARIIDTKKVGQIHLLWSGDKNWFKEFFATHKGSLVAALAPLTENMQKRGGGVLAMELVDQTSALAEYWQVRMEFETCDAMGANFINSILEETARQLRGMLPSEKAAGLEVIMCILSNFTPECAVEVWVECPVADLGVFGGGMDSETFARRFKAAVDIARVDKSRAVTHNKGIMNGVDAVILATGNDFRAIEACAHAWAAEEGSYRSLSRCEITNGLFRFSMRLPLALGTVGGLTGVHPLARLSLGILGHPSAQELMQIAAATGLAQNFSAVRSLVTTGIQKGHMKLHLLNILQQLEATEDQKAEAKIYFADKVVSFKAVRELLEVLNKNKSNTSATHSSMRT